MSKKIFVSAFQWVNFAIKIIKNEIVANKKYGNCSFKTLNSHHVSYMTDDSKQKFKWLTVGPWYFLRVNIINSFFFYDVLS